MTVLMCLYCQTDLQPTLELDPTSVFHTSIVSALLTADNAESDSSPVTESPYSHIQCLVDGLLDDLTAEQPAHAEAFIRGRMDVFLRSEYDW